MYIELYQSIKKMATEILEEIFPSNNEKQHLVDAGYILLEWKQIFSNEEIFKLELHSVLNVILQINALAYLIGLHIDNNENLFIDMIKELKKINAMTLDETEIIDILKSWKIQKLWMDLLTSKIIPRAATEGKNDSKIDEYIHVFKKLIINSSIPINSFLERYSNWLLISFSNEFIINQLTPILIAISTNSKKNWNWYWFVFSKKNKRDNDYLINIKIDNLELPKVFFDIIRDSILNARKYSNIWSIIDLEIWKIDHLIWIKIRDQGIWIPSDEIQKIIWAGFRWSNVRKDSWWFWLGMTKMFHYVRKYNGQIFVKTELWKWTEFLILLPKFTQKSTP